MSAGIGCNRQLVSIGQGGRQEDEDACESFHCHARIAARYAIAEAALTAESAGFV